MKTDVAELVDALDLGSSRFSCEGSSPSIRNKKKVNMNNLERLKKTEHLIKFNQNRYKITIELAKIAKEYAYEYKDTKKTNALKINKPIIKGLKQMQTLNSKK